MECGKLTAKLRDAVPVCFIENGKELKRYKNIEIPDDLKKLPYKDFRFDVPMNGAITFKIIFEQGILPEAWPEARERRTRAMRNAQEATPVEAEQPEETADSAGMASEESTAVEEAATVEEAVEADNSLDAALDAIIAGVEPQEPENMTIHFNVTGERRKALVEALGSILYSKPVYKNAPTFAYAIDGYMVDKTGTLTGEYNAALLAALEEEGFTAAN